MSGALSRSWREAAALIMLSETRAAGRCDYEVLLETRPAAGSFGNSAVFPGGVAEPADSAPHWLQLLASFGYSRAELNALYAPRAGAPLPLILRPDPVLRQVSLRITAIRETFEEVGVLVCTREHRNECSSPDATPITDFDIPYWQKKVSEDPSALYALCRKLRCCPAVDALHVRTSWLSPATLGKRFDTAFFLAALTERPAVHPSSEVVHTEWVRPGAVLQAGARVLFPPQAYELVLLSRRPESRSLPPAATHYHASVRARDGLLYVLPGDDLYPESIDYNCLTVLSSELSVAELRERAGTAHRIESVAGNTAFVFKHYGNMDLLVASVRVTFS